MSRILENYWSVHSAVRVNYIIGRSDAAIGWLAYAISVYTMGFFKKMTFWKRGNVSPIMVDASVCTEEPRVCDVGTNTDVVYEGDMNSRQSPPPAEYAEGCDFFRYYSPPEWPESYSYYVPPQEYEEWGQSYSYGAPAPEYAQWWGTYGYSSPPAYPPEWFYVAPL
jgi:hypothetical protein